MEIKRDRVFFLVECRGFNLDLWRWLIRTGEEKNAKLEETGISYILYIVRDVDDIITSVLSTNDAHL